MRTINEIRYALAAKYAAGDITNGTIELIGESFTADEPSIFGRPNQDYISRELDWYKSGSLNVNDIPGGAPQIWKRVSSSTGVINSNYGHLLMSEENGSQLVNVVTQLVADPGTRRATAVYTRPSIHTDWNVDGMTDFICTNAVQYLIRDNRLHVVVQMRSNDVVFGYRNDYAWQVYIQDLLINVLGEHGLSLRPGTVTWHVASLHVYERHFWMLDHFLKTGDPMPEVN